LYGTKPASFSDYSYVSEACRSVAIAPNGTIGLCGNTHGAQQLVITNGATTDYTFTTTLLWDAQQRYGYMGFVAQWNAAGTLLWMKDDLFGINSGRYWTAGLNLATNANAELYMAAETMSKSLNGANYQPKLLKYNNAGVQQWTNTIGFYATSPMGFPVTRVQTAFYNGKAYISEKVAYPHSGLGSNAQECRVVCFNDFGTQQWSSIYTNANTAISSLAAKENVYAGGSLATGSFGNLTAVYTSGADAFLAKMQQYIPPVLPLAFSAPNPDKAICAGGSITLAPNITVTGGVQPYSYSWSPGIGLSNATVLNPTAAPGTTTNYVLTVTDAVGTQLRDTVQLTVRAPLAKPTVQLIPGISPSVYDTLVCVSPETGLIYDWRNSFGSLVGSSAKLLVFKAQAERYRVSITNGLNGCSASSDIFYYYFIKANAGNDTTVCAGQPITLGGTPAYFGMPGGTITYHWLSIAGVFSTPSLSNPHITITPTITADYILFIDDGSAIPEFMDTVRITVTPGPTLGPIPFFITTVIWKPPTYWVCTIHRALPQPGIRHRQPRRLRAITG
jgi:hypothetical protein